MDVLQKIVTPPHTCAYLGDRNATLEYACVSALSGQEYEDKMNAGYRKFGMMLFRPVCENCSECRPVRVETARFVPSRSQRRAWQKNQDLAVRLERPTADAERLNLYKRYHDWRTELRHWPEQEVSLQDYASSFVFNPIPSVEITLWLENRLCAVLLTDITPNTVSNIYHYHDPELSSRSLGTCLMLHTFELARRLNRRWVYFGFYVRNCASLEFKAKYRPCEILNASGEWQPFVDA
jgi:leucyl-tRNA---protein transferase